MEGLFFGGLVNRFADVVIAGAGPAGSTAAFVLASRGFSVTLLDKSEFPRKKLCGGLLTLKVMRLLERLHGMRATDLTDSGVVEAVTAKWSVHYRERLLAQGGFSYPFHLVDRMKFDLLLLNKARTAGASFIHCQVLKAHPRGVLETDAGEYSGLHIIGADGVNSMVRQAFALPRERWTKYLASTIEITIPKAESPRISINPELYAGILPAGYGWLFPNKDNMILGICGLRQYTPNFRTAFSDFLSILGCENTDDFMARHPLHGHPLPYGNVLEKPYLENTLLAGDAGGFADPLLGEGIFYALLTGWYAGEAIADALQHGQNAGERYARLIAQFVMPEMRGANRLRWFLHGLDRFMSPGAIGGYFNLRNSVLAEMVHGVRSYSWARKKNWDF